MAAAPRDSALLALAGVSMRTGNTTTAVCIMAVLAIGVGCPVTEPGTDDEAGSTEDPSGTGESSDGFTDDDSTESTSDSETDAATEETGTETTADLEWHVYDAADNFVGTLATPDADAFADHDDMFGAGIEPSVAYLTNDEGHGFLLNQAGPSTIILAHDEVLYSGPDCTGTPMDYFATMLVDGTTLPLADCNPEGVEANLDQIQVHYGLKESAAEFVELRWPGALGLLMSRDYEQWYGLPVDQPWPTPTTALSRRAVGGACGTFADAIPVCAVEFVETDWQIVSQGGGPFRLVQE